MVFAGRRELRLRQPDYEELSQSLLLTEGDNPCCATRCRCCRSRRQHRWPRWRRCRRSLGGAGPGRPGVWRSAWLGWGGGALLGFGASAAYFDRRYVTGDARELSAVPGHPRPAIGLLVSGGVLTVAGLALKPGTGSASLARRATSARTATVPP